jgi:hypothetical protein
MSDPTYQPRGGEPASQGRPFFSALFDTSFRTFITPRIIGILYILAIIVIAVYALVAVAAGFSADAGVGIFTLVIVAPLIFFLGVLYARVLLEVFIVLFRIEQNTRESRPPQPPGTPPQSPGTT